MAFYDEMRTEVLQHGAINNPYLSRFTTGALTDGLRIFALSSITSRGSSEDPRCPIGQYRG